MKISNILLFCFITTNVLFSQSTFLNKGQNGLGVSGEYFVGSRDDLARSGFGISIGYSYNGIFDVGLSYKSSSIDDPDDDAESLFSPNFSMHIFKQSESVPLSLFFNIGYITGSKNEDYSEYYTDIAIQGYAIKGEVYRTFKINPTLSFKPFFSYAYYSLTESLKNRHVDHKDNVIKNNPSIGLDFVFKLKNSNLFVIGTIFTRDKDFIGDYDSLSIVLSYIFLRKTVDPFVLHH